MDHDQRCKTLIKYALPVLPIGLFLRVGLDGIGMDAYEERFWELRPLHFEYLYVALPGLNAVEFVEGFDRLVAGESYKGVQAMNTTWYEKGVEKGHREFLRDMLDERFGPLSPAVLAKLEELPVDRLHALRRAILKARSLEELGLNDEGA